MKAIVDKDLCIGCGLCVEMCPQVFLMDKNGKATAKDAAVPSETEASCHDAAQQCPVEAISITK